MNRSIVLALCLLGAAAPAPRAVTVVRTARVHTVSGAVVERGMIVIQDGKIVDVRPAGATPPGAEVIEADNLVVIPGLVDAHTGLADGGRDADDSVAPDVRAIDGYDFYQGNWRQLAGGVTTVGLSPGSQRLLSGQSAVVKTAGKDPESRILSGSCGLRVTLGELPKNPPALYAPPVPPSADRPLQPARRQYPSSRMGAFAALREAARKPGLLKDRRLPLLVQAHNEDDLVKAVLFAEEAGLRIVLIDAEEAPRVADFLAEHKVPVLFNPSYSPGRRDLTDDERPLLEATGSPEGAAALAKAGVKFALHAPEDADLSELLFIAAAAVRGGLPERDALHAITLAPAEILGVADRVGSLAAGRDADLVFLSADPFAPGATVQRVMVNGAMVFERKDADVQTYRVVRDSSGKGREILAIRNGRVLTVTQGILPDGLVFIEGGKISYVGRGRPIPVHAKIIEAEGLTVVPGFIDFTSHLGFHLDRTEQGLRRGPGNAVPPALYAPPSTLVRLDDPAFRAAAQSGVTSILLSPETSGVCSLVKLTKDRSTVVREVAAVKFVAQGGTAGYQALKDQLQRGRKYHEEWEAYERAKKEPAAPKPAPAEGPRDPVTGTWKGQLEAPEQNIKGDFTLELKLEGARVTGTFQAQVTAGRAEPVEGTFVNNELKVERTQQGMKAELAMKLLGPDHLKGTWRVSGPGMELKGGLECRREAAAAAPAKAELKEPRKDETLEPFRKLFLRDIPAIVIARNLPAIENATRAFREDFNLECVLAGAEDAAYAGDWVTSKGAGVALGPDFLQDRRGARVNTAEALAAQGVTIAFTSAAHSATRHLPLTAAYAVRHGLDPFDALKALTVNPARMLKVEGRMGSIERGRDADLLIFTGDPFAPASRLRAVIIDGKVVYEGK